MEGLTKEKKTAPAREGKSLPPAKKPRIKKWMKVLAVVAAAGVLMASCVSRAARQVSSQLGGSYLVEKTTRQDLTISVTGTAALKPADSYSVTTLLSGEIDQAPFEEGDLVEKGALLFAMDSSDARNGVNRSDIAVSQAQLQYQQAQLALYPEAGVSGTIRELYVHNGDSVNVGAPLCKIAADTEVTGDFSFPYADPAAFYVGQKAEVWITGYAGGCSGTVTAVSNASTIVSGAGGNQAAVMVRIRIDDPGLVTDGTTASAVIGGYSSSGQSAINLGGTMTIYASGSGTVQGMNKLSGSTVTRGERLCTIESAGSRTALENARLALENARLAASMSEDALDDYNITSQISGTVIEKNFKAGDKVEGMSSGSLAVIYDMSYLKLELAVDELDIGKVEVGQTVDITADALEGQSFTGVVDKISINGTTVGGATSYPVTILIAQYGALKPGMNVSATIRGQGIPNVLCIPVDAVDRGSTVTVPLPGALNPEGTAVADITKLETREVTLGRNDGNYIEVLAGLEEGDIVLIANQSSGMAAVISMGM